MLAVVLLGTGVFVAHTLQQPGVYWSDVHVRFVAPTNPTNPNSLQVSEKSLIMTAGAVGEVIDDSDGPRTSSSDVHISGLGVKSGWSVTLPNSGGQYINYYADPYLDLQVVGPDPVTVQRTMQRLVAKTESTLAELQDRADVPQSDRISAKVLPLSSAPMYYEHGSRKRALAAGIALMIGAVAAAIAAGLSRFSRRPRGASLALAG